MTSGEHHQEGERPALIITEWWNSSSVSAICVRFLAGSLAGAIVSFFAAWAIWDAGIQDLWRQHLGFIVAVLALASGILGAIGSKRIWAFLNSVWSTL